ncbi:MAG: hypothetical protein UR68_C0001G0076 [Candidatus Roizmanbacteria bacterium GW2011_GWA2_35_19]|uniref:DUF5678 domain-containing protein n=2 Tax=Candidatus Roizmaniibacteriota TaxID=1752723 RepID=A0A0G0CEG7_9BACT|nr:MAG: hypothetical protein UR63_C0012G0022 [Candidatus Roizmanbacteria bacterium GW2011_GWC2_35_12]KKP74476.1 MAG: hypothetical protein UR68_C0001G0076 [Candidatus Roizmanbacteria bacterium GW2011_GWA2_35_19]
MKNYIDLTNIQKKYRGSWIALDNNLKKVISNGQDAKSVYDIAIKQGYKIPTLFKVPKKITPYFGVSFI